MDVDRAGEHDFATQIEIENATGRIRAVYLQVRAGQAPTTGEMVAGTVLADYNRQGDLLGVELLAPCELGVLDEIAQDDATREYFRRTVPLGFIIPVDCPAG